MTRSGSAWQTARFAWWGPVEVAVGRRLKFFGILALQKIGVKESLPRKHSSALCVGRPRQRFEAALGLALFRALLEPAASAAQPREPAFSATAVVRDPIAATNTEDATASGSTLEMGGRKRALEDVAEALVELPGLRVRQTGGAGSTAQLALRGAEAGHTRVLLGALPLNTPDTGAFDLSLLPASAFERMEVYRGGAPAWFSAGAIGGVLRLVPRQAETSFLQATAGSGSFGRAELRLTGAAASPMGRAPSFGGHVRLLRTDNDYRFVDDGQTRFVTSDDRELRQQNADVLQGDLLAHAGLDAAGGRVTLAVVGHNRLVGVPGPLAAPTRRARRKLVRGLVSAAYERETQSGDGTRQARFELVGSASHQHNALTDLFAELGTSQQVASRDVWQGFFLRAAGSRLFGGWFEPSLIASVALDRYRPDNPAAFSLPPRPSQRLSETLTIEPRAIGTLLGLPAELRPSLRLGWSQTEIRADSGLERVTQSRGELAPTLRLAAAVAPAAALSVSASVASGARLPSILELFGDRAFQEPNPRLTRERATSLDLSAVARGRFRRARGVVELRGFALAIDDLIRFERTAQFTVRPDNVASGRIYGAELGFSGGYGRHLQLVSSFTAMRTRNPFGKQLPLRPALQALVRPQFDWSFGSSPFLAGLRQLSAFAELHHVSFVYLDAANLTHLPSRSLFSAGVSLGLGGAAGEAFGPGGAAAPLRLDVRVNNLLATPATDVLSRPLPGRDVRVSLTLHQGLLDW